MGSDWHAPRYSSRPKRFQSTLPAWGATKSDFLDDQQHGISIHAPRMGSDIEKASVLIIHKDFNPRSPHGERQFLCQVAAGCSLFQSTLPAWGATRRWIRNAQNRRNFNPRSPHGERQALSDYTTMDKGISIHAPRMGSDCMIGRFAMRRKYFNPRSPHGERH